MGAEAEDDPPQAATHASAQHPDDGAADRPAAAHRRPRTSPEQRAAQSAWCDRSSIPRDSHFFVKNPQNAQVTFERDSLGALRRRVVWPHDGSATPWNMGEGVDLRPEMPRSGHRVHTVARGDRGVPRLCTAQSSADVHPVVPNVD